MSRPRLNSQHVQRRLPHFHFSDTKIKKPCSNSTPSLSQPSLQPDTFGIHQNPVRLPAKEAYSVAEKAAEEFFRLEHCDQEDEYADDSSIIISIPGVSQEELTQSLRQVTAPISSPSNKRPRFGRPAIHQTFKYFRRGGTKDDHTIHIQSSSFSFRPERVQINSVVHIGNLWDAYCFTASQQQDEDTKDFEEFTKEFIWELKKIKISRSKIIIYTVNYKFYQLLTIHLMNQVKKNSLAEAVRTAYTNPILQRRQGKTMNYLSINIAELTIDTEMLLMVETSLRQIVKDISEDGWAFE